MHGKEGGSREPRLLSLNPWEENGSGWGGGRGVCLSGVVGREYYQCIYKYLMGVSKESIARLFSVLPSDRTRDNEKQEIQKIFFFFLFGFLP